MSLKQCCATGSLHTGTPTGRVDKLHGLDCYVADAPDSSRPKGIIIIIPDAFGWTLPNNRILADEYAKNGFQVYLPEFMQGKPSHPFVESGSTLTDTYRCERASRHDDQHQGYVGHRLLEPALQSKPRGLSSSALHSLHALQ